jgi:mono/diheme cytochrome c family protein
LGCVATGELALPPLGVAVSRGYATWSRALRLPTDLEKKHMISTGSMQMRKGRSWVSQLALCALSLPVVAGCQGSSAGEISLGTETQELWHSADRLREHIAGQVGGLDKLMVPADDASIPLPPEDPARPGRYATSEAKRYLGKLMFHDPVRTARINVNEAVPFDLPEGTAFGGTLAGATPELDAIVAAQRQTGSCGSCHLGEAAGKAGAVFNFNTGGEGRGYTDADGNFIPRRRPQAILATVRDEPVFPGDTRVDALPTLTDIYAVKGQLEVATPARALKQPTPDALIATGRLDALDSVARQSPGMIGFAFNNRLLLGGFAGEPPDGVGALNPFNDPAQENLTLLLLDAHRMLGAQAAELIKIPAFLKLFEDAFPEEARKARDASDLTVLVNDDTILRATATFLRTMVTRNTPFDRFIAGDDRALTASQRRGARLFFTGVERGGAGCVSCHSGPMLNKQVNDPDVAGIGQLVEENFINVGIGDHPLQALNALTRNKDTASHAEDTGRQEITQSADDAFKFRSVTLRQLQDARTFFHNGSFTTVRDVVSYFNAGVPQDAVAGAAPTLDARFTQPRGSDAPPGLGLSERQVDDIADFLQNGLYDPAFVTFDPDSSTPTLQPSEDDLAFSVHRPDLAALGAQDGQMLSGRAIDNDDPLSRRDLGLEFLDVTAKVNRELVERAPSASKTEHVWRLTNTSGELVDTHLLLIVSDLPAGVRLLNASGTTKSGQPYRRVFLQDGVLNPGESLTEPLVFSRARGMRASDYTVTLLSGQGAP